MITEIKLAYYRKTDWMHETWDDWHKEYLRVKKIMSLDGFTVFDVVIDLRELANYCKSRGIKNDGAARSQFVQAR